MKAGPRSQSGVSTLAVVAILVGGVLLSVAYANRGLVFEQKSSGNQYKAAQAFEAAEAGLEWALAMLNSPNAIDAACRPSMLATDLPFRESHLARDAQGVPVALEPSPPSTCRQRDDGSWSCRCAAEAAGADMPALTPGAAFSVQLSAGDSPTLLRIIATGCNSGSSPCVAEASSAADATAILQVQLSRIGGLASEPAAALTVHRAIVLGDAPYTLVNSEIASGGLTLHAGGAVSAPSLQLTSTPGTPPSTSMRAQDDALAAATDEGLHASLFRMSRADWAQQPAVLRVDCRADCGGRLTTATLGTARAQLLWLPEGLQLDMPLTLGSPDRPVLLRVDGPVRLNGRLTLHGMVYATSPDWQDPAGADIHGALVFEQSLNGSGATRVAHDAAVLRRLRIATGTYARVPGSWRDF